MITRQKLMLIFKKLLKEYGEQGWWPIIKDKSSHYNIKFKLKEKTLMEKFEISIGAILTQNTAWKNVEKALINLKQNNLLNPQGIIKVDNKKLSLLIRPAGYFNIKAKKLKEFTKFFLSHKEEFENNTISREELLNVWGIGNETADSILLYALNKPFFVVDAYTRRLFYRLGFFHSEKIKYEEAQDFFHKNLDMDYKLFNEYHALIVEHAKQHCKKKPDCEGCVLSELCQEYLNNKKRAENKIR